MSTHFSRRPDTPPDELPSFQLDAERSMEPDHERYYLRALRAHARPMPRTRGAWIAPFALGLSLGLLTMASWDFIRAAFQS